MSSFSEWLEDQMESMRIGQRELATRVGVGQTTVKGWLTGGVPGWHTCRQIADALGLDREVVRQIAGYVDENGEEAVDADPEFTELTAIWRELEQPSRTSLLVVARALRAQQQLIARQR
jgi:transcriptional regulator with XRE-family HTH domain